MGATRTAAYDWSKDKSRFGLKLMEKMGWREGKGLGQHEDGQVENIQARRHGAGVGIGAKTAAGSAWMGTAVVAQGLNEVLAKLGGEGGGQEGGVREGGKDVGSGRGRGRGGQREGRGFYARRRARGDVGSYSRSELREIFGGVDVHGGETVQKGANEEGAKVVKENMLEEKEEEADQIDGDSEVEEGEGESGVEQGVASDDGVDGCAVVEEVVREKMKERKKKKKERRRAKGKVASAVGEVGIEGGIGKKEKRRVGKKKKKKKKKCTKEMTSQL